MSGERTVKELRELRVATLRQLLPTLRSIRDHQLLDLNKQIETFEAELAQHESLLAQMTEEPS